MSNVLVSIHRPKFILAPLMFGVIYVLGVLAFIFLWTGQQYAPGFAGFEQYGLVYAAICLMGVISNFAIVLGYRWGVVGQIGVWIINAVVNMVLLNRGIGPDFGVALLLVGLWIFDVYRNRQLLRNPYTS